MLRWSLHAHQQLCRKRRLLPLNWLQISACSLKALACAGWSPHMLGPAGGTKTGSLVCAGRAVWPCWAAASLISWAAEHNVGKPLKMRVTELCQHLRGDLASAPRLPSRGTPRVSPDGAVRGLMPTRRRGTQHKRDHRMFAQKSLRI